MPGKVRRPATVQGSDTLARELMDGVPNALVGLAPDGRIAYANAAAAELMGTSRERLVRSVFADNFADPQAAKDTQDRAGAEGPQRSAPLTIHRADGRVVETAWDIAAYHRRGVGRGLVAIGRDVTDERQRDRDTAERLQRDAKRLVELERLQRVVIGRELKMVQLKQENGELRRLAERHGSGLPDR
ncbi:MAG TPA: PAS domain-containing protein [Candidatus Limnocylindria bacterium]|nr:PAS domain-containing protein [Candidatus Limnocylindria bacterium]